MKIRLLRKLDQFWYLWGFSSHEGDDIHFNKINLDLCLLLENQKLIDNFIFREDNHFRYKNKQVIPI